MKLVFSIAFCALLAAAEAGLVPHLFYQSPQSNLIFPVEFRKIIPYSKPVYSTQLFKPDIFGALQLYTFPIVQNQVPGAAPVLFVPAVRPTSTLVANANAASGAGVAGSSVVAQSDEGTPFSVVANASPAAAYSSAVVHPSSSGAPVSAGAQASVTGHN